MSAHKTPRSIDAQNILQRYQALLLDAYGVLVDQSGVLPHAVPFVMSLKKIGKPFYIVTNDASRLPSTIAARFARLGLPIHEEQIVTSASLLPQVFSQQQLLGKKAIVLGSDDALRYVALAGGEAVRPGRGAMPDAHMVVICDVTGERLVDDVECIIDTLLHRCDRKLPTHVILCNPDLIYPKSAESYGLTSGAVMLLVESSLRTRLQPSQMPTLVRLGKPYNDIFAEAARRANTRDMALIGDQLATDILGANTFGIDSILVGTGLTPLHGAECYPVKPTYLLPNLAL